MHFFEDFLRSRFLFRSSRFRSTRSRLTRAFQFFCRYEWRRTYATTYGARSGSRREPTRKPVHALQREFLRGLFRGARHCPDQDMEHVRSLPNASPRHAGK